MAATATAIDSYHRGQSTPPSAQEVRSALRLLRTKKRLSGTPAKSKAAPALAWSKPTGGSASGTPRVAAPDCLLTSACRCDRCRADYEELRRLPPTSVHTEGAGRTLVALSDDELAREGQVAPAAMDPRTEVRCRLEDQFADTVCTPCTPPPSLAAAGTLAAGWVMAAAPVAAAPPPQAPPPRPTSQPMGWEDYYDDVASRPGDDDDEDDEGVESLASLRAQVALAAQRCKEINPSLNPNPNPNQVALAAQRCKEINRLCVTELAKPDGAAETLKVNLALTGAGSRGAGATEDGGGGGGDGDDGGGQGGHLTLTLT